jgi:hypothetical protein
VQKSSFLPHELAPWPAYSYNTHRTVAHALTLLKFLLLAPFGLVAAVLVLCLAPFALAYFLFDRLCDLIESFRPQRKKKGQGNRLANIQKFLSFIPSKK